MNTTERFDKLMLSAGIVFVLSAIFSTFSSDLFVQVQIVGWGAIFAIWIRFANSVLKYHWPKSRVLGMIAFGLASILVISSMVTLSVLPIIAGVLIFFAGAVFIFSYNLWASHLSWLVNFGAGVALMVLGGLCVTGSLGVECVLCATAAVCGINAILLAFFKAKD